MTAADQSTGGGEARGRAAQLLQRADRLQLRRPFLAVAVGTWKKFSDDRAGNLAALIAYYAFASMFPLLLVLVTILDLVVRNNAGLREQLLSSALSQYPGIGEQIKDSVSSGIGTTGTALVVGLALTLFGARGVALAMQNAVNTVWSIPYYRRPRFPWSLLRGLGLIAVIGPGMIATITLSGLAGGAGHLSGALARVAAVAISLLLNVGLFWLGFRIATSAEIRTRDLRLSATLAAIAWQVLQVLGGYFVSHQLAVKSVYGVFGIVLGLLAWFYLQAQITLYVVELNVVRVRRLWPRSLAPPPLTDADMQAYELYAQASQRQPDLQIEVRQQAAPADSAGQDGPQ
jgi:membrane protein